MPTPLSIPCEDCEQRSASLRLKHFEVIGCEQDPARNGWCLLRYRDPLLGDALHVAASAVAPAATAPAPAGATAKPVPAIAAASSALGQPLLFAGHAVPLSFGMLALSCERLGVEPQALWAVVKVETSGCGFLADRRPKILFERHKFSAATGGKFDAEAPGVSNPVAGGYVGGAGEYYRLELAMSLDYEKALESASWGLGQIMGFNAKAAGFKNVRELVAASAESEDRQLQAMVAFIQDKKLAAALRDRQWSAVARVYNGKKFKEYDKHLARWYDYLALNGLPDLGLRRAQVALMLLGYAVEGSVDGVYGKYTRDALTAFQRAENLEPDGLANEDTLQRLDTRAGWV